MGLTIPINIMYTLLNVTNGLGEIRNLADDRSLLNVPNSGFALIKS